MSITITDIPVNDLISNPHNPRSGVGDVRELADSIRAQGLQQQLDDDAAVHLLLYADFRLKAVLKPDLL